MAMKRNLPDNSKTSGAFDLARVVGYALHANPEPGVIPCHRVVNRFGEVSPAFAFGGKNEQIGLLEAEGVPCPDGRVDLETYQWRRRAL